jgi:hypothetical protein
VRRSRLSRLRMLVASSSTAATAWWFNRYDERCVVAGRRFNHYGERCRAPKNFIPGGRWPATASPNVTVTVLLGFTPIEFHITRLGKI